MRKATETEILGLTLPLLFGFLETEPKFGFRTSLIFTSCTDVQHSFMCTYTVVILPSTVRFYIRSLYILIIACRQVTLLFSRGNIAFINFIHVCLFVCTTKPKRLKLQSPNLPQRWSITRPGYPFNFRSKVKVSGSQSAKTYFRRSSARRELALVVLIMAQYDSYCTLDLKFVLVFKAALLY